MIKTRILMMTSSSVVARNAEKLLKLISIVSAMFAMREVSGMTQFLALAAK